MGSTSCVKSNKFVGIHYIQAFDINDSFFPFPLRDVLNSSLMKLCNNSSSMTN